MLGARQGQQGQEQETGVKTRAHHFTQMHKARQRMATTSADFRGQDANRARVFGNLVGWLLCLANLGDGLDQQQGLVKGVLVGDLDAHTPTGLASRRE